MPLLCNRNSALEDKEQPLYNLASFDAPRLVGWKVLMFPKLLRSPLIGSTILKLLKKKNQFDKMTTFASTLRNVQPIHNPIHVMSDQERALHENMVTESPLDLTVLARSENQHHTRLDEEGSEVFRYWSIQDFTSRYESQEITPLEAMNRLIKKVKDSEETNPIIVFMNVEDVLNQASESTMRYKSGQPLGVLDGVPIAVKDEIPVKGFPVTKGTSFILEYFDEDCECIERLRNQGAIILGKTNQHEMGLGTTGYNRHYGSPRNPHNYRHYTGGSSSGSAAAVAAGLVPLAIGTDGGGSIRIPSALCGVVGLKPTYKRIVFDGGSVVAIGPIAGCLNDAALAYAIMAGPSRIEEHDSSHLQPQVHLHNFTNPPNTLEGVRVGLFRAHVEDSEKIVKDATMRTIEHLRSLGASIVEIEIPHLHEIRLSHSVTIVSESYTSVHMYHNDHKNDFSGEVQITYEIGKTFSSHDFVASQKIRAYAISLVKELFSTQIDVLISPVTATTAPLFPDDAIIQGESDLKTTVQLMKYSFLGNFTGNPGLVIPPVAYDNETELPISVLFQSAHWREDLLFRVAKACESMKPNCIKKPKHYIGGALDA